jgi:hypothetical protein
MQDYKLAKLLIVTKNQSLNDIKDLMIKAIIFLVRIRFKKQKKNFKS